MKDLTCGIGAEKLITEDFKDGEEFYNYVKEKGFATLEDVIETLLGSEIVDEQDTVRDMQQLARERWERINARKVPSVQK